VHEVVRTLDERFGGGDQSGQWGDADLGHVVRQMKAIVTPPTPSLGGVPAPSSVKELASHPFKSYYEAAAKIEIEALKKRGTLKKLIPIAEVLKMGKKPAKSRIIYAYKKDVFHQGGPNGPKGERAKARYIICGYSLRPGIDYNKTASPSADMTVWRMLISLQVMIDRGELVNWQFDVPTAYLWANKRTHRVFMHQAEGYEEPDSAGMCWELGTFLYGEPPAGLGWYLELVEALESAGFSKNPACPSLFAKIERRRAAFRTDWYDNEDNAHRRIYVRAPDSGECGVMGRDFLVTYVLLQVDDGKVVGNCQGHLTQLKDALQKFETKWHSPLKDFIGAEEEEIEPGVVKVTATKQVRNFVTNYAKHLSGKRERVPARTSEGYRVRADMEADGPEERAAMKGKPYREVIGSATYIARLCSPTLSFAISECAQHVNDAGLRHWRILLVVADFLADRGDEGLIFRTPSSYQRQLVTVSDANWAGDKETRRSTDGFCVWLWGNLIAFGCKKQPFVAQSSFESELGGASRAAREVAYCQQVLSGMGIMLELPVPCYIDNKGLVQALENVTHVSSAKHIDMRMFWMKDSVERGVLEPLHVLSGDNIADALTKALGEKQFWKLMDDATGRRITRAGAHMRAGRRAYQAFVQPGTAAPTRPKVRLVAAVPEGDMRAYYGPDGRGHDGTEEDLSLKPTGRGEIRD
jgi:hypothetical protein